MPYQVYKEGSEFVVRKQGGGKAIGKHKTKAEAEAQMRALYAGERRSRKSLDADEPAELLVYQGGAVKAAGETGEIIGYLVRWGSPEQPDATKAKDYFTPETDLGRFVKGELDGYYHHGLPVKSNAIGDAVIGSGTVKADDEGLLLAATLDLRVEGMAGVWAALKADDHAFGLSSGAVSHLMRTVEQPNGTHLVRRWPIVEWSLLPASAAAEPRTAAVALKALLEDEAIKGDYLGGSAEAQVAYAALDRVFDLARSRIRGLLGLEGYYDGPYPMPEGRPSATRAEKLAAIRGCLDEMGATALRAVGALIEEAPEGGPAVKSLSLANDLLTRLQRQRQQ